MRSLLFTLLILPLVFSNQTTYASGIDFFHGSFQEALELAKAEDKVIFVDAYTTWCGPCKRMSANVFPQKEVGDYFNENFVSMKIDMEKPAGLEFRKKYPVSAFPTLYFIGGDGKTVHMTKGAHPVDKFIKLGKMVMSKVDYSADFAFEYNAGNREPELMYKYVKALVKSGKPSGKVANEYINSQKDLTTDFNRRFLLAATVEADTRIFEKMVEQRSAISALESAGAVDAVIEKACLKTVRKAIEYQSKDLLEESKAKMKQYLPAKSTAFANHADMTYYKAQGDVDKYLKVCGKHVKKNVKNNASELHDIALDIKDSFDKKPKALAAAEKYAKQAAEYGGLSKYYLTYAQILLENKNKSEALAMAKKALDLAEGKKREQSEAIKLIRIIEREG